jgi:hypothetical protein
MELTGDWDKSQWTVAQPILGLLCGETSKSVLTFIKLYIYFRAICIIVSVQNKHQMFADYQLSDITVSPPSLWDINHA